MRFVSHNSLKTVCALLFSCAVLLLSPLVAQAKDSLPIEQFYLSNGMEVVVITNHRVPAITHMIWFRVGGADDPLGKSGLTHFHEHMMFQGSENYKKGEYSDIIARHGGKENAFTGYDATAYHATLPRQNLEQVMQLEADRLNSLKPDRAEAEREREVIIEERRQRIENNPASLFREQLNATLYYHHPYGTPLIGWMSEMEQLKVEDVLELHKTHYHPANAILVISGDITAKELRPLAERYYGSIPAGPKVEHHWVQEPPHRAARRIEMHHPNQLHPLWTRTYLSPSMKQGASKHVMPLFVLEYILGGAKSSRLYQELVVKQKLATQVSINYDGMRKGPGEFTLSAVPAEGIELEALEAAIDHELQRLQASPPSDEEMKRAKGLQKASAIYAREGLQSMAYMLGWIRVTDLPLSTFEGWPDEIEAVKAEQVREAATFVFDKTQSVTGVLLPEKGS